MIWWEWRTKFEGKVKPFRENKKQALKVMNTCRNPVKQQIVQQFSKEDKKGGG